MAGKIHKRFTISQDLGSRTGRELLRHVLLRPWFQGVMIAVITIDVICLIIWDVMHSRGHERTPLAGAAWHVGLCTLAAFALECVLRFIAFGFRNFVRSGWNCLDVVIVAGGLTLFLRNLPGDEIVGARLLKLLRWLRWLRVLRTCSRCGPVVKVFKRLVSKSKARYIDEDQNFDLDLSYISRDLIAMGVPATSCLVGMYRNPIRQVARFFQVRHKDNFRIYNLCPELPYTDELFKAQGGEVMRFEIQDHTPPTMAQFIEFLTDAGSWKSTDDHREGALAIHCKAGKGRTGSLCCAWLLYSERRKSVAEALELFAQRRTDADLQSNAKRLCGVETPSQVRYIHQLWRHLNETDSWFSSPSPLPPCPAPGIALEFLAFEGGLFAKPEKMKPLKVLVQCGGASCSVVVLETQAVGPEAPGVPLLGTKASGDVRISVFEEKEPGFSAQKAMTRAENAHQATGLVLLCAFHTNFMRPAGQSGRQWLAEGVEGVGLRTFRVPVEEIDKAHKKVKKGKHAANSSLVLSYAEIPAQTDDVELQPVDAKNAAEVSSEFSM